ncbi:MAG: co-chaperone GroES family protein [Rhodothermia bacterium]|nr:MAG: co-chaperone GroES family protein [Rhodothermia bacterium]
MSELIIVGDRVLIAPHDGERQTAAGLVLPASVAEREKVQSGSVVSVGPGYIVPNPEFSEDDSWKPSGDAIRYLPLQVRPGDQAYFLKKDAIEITYQKQDYLIVQHSAILALLREDANDILENLSGLDQEEGLRD